MKIQTIAIVLVVSTMTTSLIAQENRRIDMWEEPRHQLVFSKDQLKIMDQRRDQLRHGSNNRHPRPPYHLLTTKCSLCYLKPFT